MSKRKKSVLIDTSFLIRLLDDNGALHQNAVRYFKEFVLNDYELFISTIAISEYLVRGKIENIPLDRFKKLAYTMQHSIETARIAPLLYAHRGKLSACRDSVKDDCKMFAQANCEGIDYFISSDTEAKNLCEKQIKDHIKFEFIDINQKCSEFFGLLPLDDNDPIQ